MTLTEQEIETLRRMYHEICALETEHRNVDTLCDLALAQVRAGKASISEFEQIVKDESAQWKGVGDDTHGAQTACQMILQKIAALKEHT